MKAAFCGLLLLPQKGVKPLELFKIMGTIALNNQEANSELDETGQKAENAHSKIAGAFSKIGGAAVAAGKVVATGLAAGATAIGAIAKSSLDSYAEYEQLVGGVETLFKDSGAKVMAYASKAYTSAGMSANAYMETVTSFSASLLQGLGGDTDKAADIANRAISDMSDNANKMGTDISMIQNAYQGFAKQNYTMLDNLKLGYGGTKSEMERLLKDAGKLANTKFKISSYADVVEAIHVIQENMGITGTTAKEANFTIQGSLNSMKAAWGNLMPALIKGGDEFDQCVDNLIESIIGVENESGKFEGGVINNIMPALEKGLSGIGTLIERLAPTIEEHLPGLIDRLLPPLIKAGTSLFIGLVKALPNIVKIIIDELPTVAKMLGDGIREAFGNNEFVTRAFENIEKFFSWIKDNADKVKKVAIGAGAAIGGIFVAVKGFKAFKAISSIFSSAGEGAGGVGKGKGPLEALGKMNTKTVLKGLANLAIIIGGLTALAAALMFVAPYMAQLSDFKSILKIVAVIGIVGLLGTGLAYLAGKIGNIPVATVSKGLANMAIVLVGFGALAAAFLWLSPYMAALGDFKSILKVVAVMGVLGVLGTALSVLAGIVGIIPVSTVSLGLANMAIVLVGFGALASAFLWLAPYIAALGDLKSILKVAAIMTILGVVGAALSVFAGIVGLIPIPVVLTGLANMALVLGGMTALISAFGGLAKIPGFADFLAGGGEILVQICDIIGKMAGALLGGAIEQLSESLPALGKNLGDFGKNIKPLFSAMGGVDMAGVGTFFTSLVGLLGIATGNEIVEGIKSFFGGGEESALSKLGTQLSDFATNSKTFFTTVAELPENGFSNATKMFECLAGIKGMPKDGGVAGWFTGEVDFTKISNGLASLSNENVGGFFKFTAGLTQKGFDMATALFDCLAGMKSLPDDGGVVGWFMGETDYSKLAEGLGHLASDGVKSFFSMVKGLDKATFANTTELFKSLSEIGNLELPTSGGFFGIGGESTLAKMATELADFGENTKDFFKQVNELKTQNLKELFNSLGELENAISDLKGTTENDFGEIVKAVKSNCVKAVNQIKSAAKQINTVISSTNLKPSGVKMMNTLISGINSKKSAVISAITSITNAINSKLNSVIGGGNWTLKQFGSDTRLETYKYARGTSGHKGGNAIVNDGRGAELVQMPNGKTFIPRGRNVFLPNAPRGMKVLDAERTARLLGKGAPTFRYADGTGDLDVWSFLDGKTLADAVVKKFVDYGGMSGFALNAGTAGVTTAKGAMSTWAGKIIEEFGAKGLASYVASAGVEQWRSTVIKALKMEGLYSEANVKRTLFQMQTESGGNPFAINLWDINAKNGTPSKGLMQVIDPTFRAYARPGFNSNIYDPLSNILAAIRYATARYGSLANAFQGHGYSDGVGFDSVSLPQYTPSGSVTTNSTSNAEYNTYAPVFNLTINGASDEKALARKVKNWVAESLEECFESMARNNATVY